MKTQAKNSCSQANLLKDQRFNRYKFPSRRDRIGSIKSYYICYTPIHIKVPVAFRRFQVENVIIWFNNYFILSGIQEKNKTTYKLVNVEEMPYFFWKYLYKVDIVWCDVIIGTYILFVCIHAHM